MKKIIAILFLLFFSIANATTILFLGDSLTEGYGLNKEAAYPSLVEARIATQLDKKVEVINGGVSGSTTSDGLARLKWYLKKNPDIVFIALGANDGLRGLDLKESQKNLEQMIRRAKEAGAKVVLAGMLIPPNYGPTYTKAFKAMYETLKTQHDLRMLPFLLEGVAGEKEYNQNDGIHPNATGHEIIAEHVVEFLKEDL